MLEEWKRCVVRVWDGDPREGRFLGSAFLIRPESLLTCRHVIAEAKGPDIFLLGPSWTGAQRAARIITHPTRDIALITIASSFDRLADPIQIFDDDESNLENISICIAGYLTPTG